MKVNKIKTGILCIVTCLAVFLATVLIATSIGSKIENSDAQIEMANSENILQISTAASAEDAKYVLKAYGGFVAIFKNDETSPSLITDISLDLLRARDRTLIENGITVFSETEVLQLIEDFNS